MLSVSLQSAMPCSSVSLIAAMSDKVTRNVSGGSSVTCPGPASPAEGFSGQSTSSMWRNEGNSLVRFKGSPEGGVFLGIHSRTRKEEEALEKGI